MAERVDVWFTSGSDRVSAWLYRPTESGAAPLLVMAHRLGAVRTMRLDAYDACLVFDYRNFGDSEGRPRQLLDIGMQLADCAAAVAYARTLENIDHDRIGLWGTSFGGGRVIATAARLPGIAAVVAQCPFTDGIASIRAINPVTVARIAALAVRDLAGALTGKPPVLIPTAGKPGELALMPACPTLLSRGAFRHLCRRRVRACRHRPDSLSRQAAAVRLVRNRQTPDFLARRLYPLLLPNTRGCG
nr:alpha/beta fold hydrolase [Mycobacterium simiae]